MVFGKKSGLVASSVTGGIVTAAGAVNALPIIGFGAAGVKAGSIAALIQSTVYGAAVPAGSWFAGATSMGAVGVAAAPVITVAAPVGAAVGVAAWLITRK